MKKRILSVFLMTAFVGMPALVGCEREVAHDEKTTVNSDGSSTHKETTVKQDSDGTVVKEQKRVVNNP